MNPFDLVEADLVTTPVIEPSRAGGRRFAMRRRVLESVPLFGVYRVLRSTRAA